MILKKLTKLCFEDKLNSIFNNNETTTSVIENFDASLIWGPVMGRNIYAGIRYKIK